MIRILDDRDADSQQQVRLGIGIGADVGMGITFCRNTTAHDATIGGV